VGGVVGVVCGLGVFLSGWLGVGLVVVGGGGWVWGGGGGGGLVSFYGGVVLIFLLVMFGGGGFFLGKLSSGGEGVPLEGGRGAPLFLGGSGFIPALFGVCGVRSGGSLVFLVVRSLLLCVFPLAFVVESVIGGGRVLFVSPGGEGFGWSCFSLWWGLFLVACLGGSWWVLVGGGLLRCPYMVFFGLECFAL